MWFITSVIVISAFGLPVVLCRANAVCHSLSLSLCWMLDSRFISARWASSWRRMWWSSQRSRFISSPLLRTIVFLVVIESISNDKCFFLFVVDRDDRRRSISFAFPRHVESIPRLVDCSALLHSSVRHCSNWSGDPNDRMVRHVLGCPMLEGRVPKLVSSRLWHWEHWRDDEVSRREMDDRRENISLGSSWPMRNVAMPCRFDLSEKDIRRSVEAHCPSRRDHPEERFETSPLPKDSNSSLSPFPCSFERAFQVRRASLRSTNGCREETIVSDSTPVPNESIPDRSFSTVDNSLRSLEEKGRDPVKWHRRVVRTRLSRVSIDSMLVDSRLRLDTLEKDDREWTLIAVDDSTKIRRAIDTLCPDEISLRGTSLDDEPLNLVDDEYRQDSLHLVDVTIDGNNSRLVSNDPFESTMILKESFDFALPFLVDFLRCIRRRDVRLCRSLAFEPSRTVRSLRHCRQWRQHRCRTELLLPRGIYSTTRYQQRQIVHFPMYRSRRSPRSFDCWSRRISLPRPSIDCWINTRWMRSIVLDIDGSVQIPPRLISLLDTRPAGPFRVVLWPTPQIDLRWRIERDSITPDLRFSMPCSLVCKRMTLVYTNESLRLSCNSFRSDRSSEVRFHCLDNTFDTPRSFLVLHCGCCCSMATE